MEIIYKLTTKHPEKDTRLCYKQVVLLRVRVNPSDGFSIQGSEIGTSASFLPQIPHRTFEQT